jgi:hypothetical protein
MGLEANLFPTPNSPFGGESGSEEIGNSVSSGAQVNTKPYAPYEMV